VDVRNILPTGALGKAACFQVTLAYLVILAAAAAAALGLVAARSSLTA